MNKFSYAETKDLLLEYLKSIKIFTNLQSVYTFHFYNLNEMVYSHLTFKDEHGVVTDKIYKFQPKGFIDFLEKKWEEKNYKLFDFNVGDKVCYKNTKYEKIVTDLYDGEVYMRVSDVNQGVSKQNFYKIATEKEKEIIYEYAKSITDIHVEGDYFIGVDRVEIDVWNRTVKYDLKLRNTKIDAEHPDADLKVVYPNGIANIANIKDFMNNENKTNDMISGGLFIENFIKSMEDKEVMENIKEFNRQTPEGKQLTRDLFEYFSEHKPEELKSVDGVQMINDLEDKYQCRVIGYPYHSNKPSGTIKRYSVVRSVKKDDLKRFLELKKSYPVDTKEKTLSDKITATGKEILEAVRNLDRKVEDLKLKVDGLNKPYEIDVDNIHEYKYGNKIILDYVKSTHVGTNYIYRYFKYVYDVARIDNYNIRFTMEDDSFNKLEHNYATIKNLKGFITKQRETIHNYGSPEYFQNK